MALHEVAGHRFGLSLQLTRTSGSLATMVVFYNSSTGHLPHLSQRLHDVSYPRLLHLLPPLPDGLLIGL